MAEETMQVRLAGNPNPVTIKKTDFNQAIHTAVNLEDLKGLNTTQPAAPIRKTA
jgi:hypothetical protein